MSSITFRSLAKLPKKAAFLLKDEGVLYLRFPNVRYHALLYRVLTGLKSAEFAARYAIFHKYSFSGRFIKRKLVENGLKCVRIFNSPVSNISKTADVKCGLLPRVGMKTIIRTTIGAWLPQSVILQTRSGRSATISKTLEKANDPAMGMAKTITVMSFNKNQRYC